jgi:membrane protease YdiL (CAAX protease family)
LAHLGSSVPGDEDDGLPPRTRADGGIWLVIALAGFLVGQVLSAVLLYVGAAATGNLSDVARLADRSVPPAWVVVCGLVGLWIGFSGAVVVASRARGTGSIRRDMRLEVRPWDVVIGPAVGLAFQLVLLPLLYLPLEYFIPHLSKRLSQPAKHLTGGFPGADLVVIAVLTVVVVPVIEEMLFRGLVLRGFLRVFNGAGRLVGPVLACCATGIVFGLAHFELLELFGLAVFGVVLSWMAYKFRRLGPCIFAHAAFNLVAILVVASSTGVIR